MTEFERWAKALAITETQDKPEKFGDAGRACGRWQQHPEFFDEYYPGPALSGETWDAWFRRALTAFWLSKRSKYQEPQTLASIFHLGFKAWQRGDTDGKYDNDFARAWAALAPEPPKPEDS